MKPFYLTKNAQGYYRAVFFNQQTGVCVKTKSTHTKDKMEAMLLAAEWYKNGTPDGYTNSRKKADDDVSVSGLNLDGIVKRLSQAEAVLLVSLISQKFNLNANISVATADPTPRWRLLPLWLLLLRVLKLRRKRLLWFTRKTPFLILV